jgi:hypothetical protein
VFQKNSRTDQKKNQKFFDKSNIDDDSLKRQQMISSTLVEEITKKALARSKTVKKEELATETNKIFSHFLIQSNLKKFRFLKKFIF